ncbi:hypothetical protein A2617_00100 [Candidatus Daviesbacteria bacterium RIFOXYD1_FULL_41_10]|uniref:HIT domain-containing protein n=2 Tax=Candidatus Daviesiibacteriota TaxID=1752718 RepID=A0A1F5N1G2_9BACT|nr:MAG: hypothetical protein UU67_C0026G0011 [Candidatus Daviesbacteria bacterium GW2011_GWB1_41_5]OGE71330.1 MAG: hypothetical protein A2617_00100 [Candidatus Daviesbacteria bacterium RIFOXYD1_FULL_41_10]
MATQLECGFCNPPEKYQKFYIRDYGYWRVALHESQVYLGRCIIPLKRHLEDQSLVTPEEWMEMLQITRDLWGVTKELFGTGRFNLSTLGNEINHTHFHFIPRYEKKVVFEGITFRDDNWGKNYTPYNRGLLVPEEIQLKIRDAIKSELA